MSKGLEGIAKDGSAAIESAQKELEQIAKPVFDSGKNLGDSFSLLTSQLGISQAEEKLEIQAIEAGFVANNELTAKQQFELATDSGSVVIGSKDNVVNFGLIGNILPTDPSPFFIANASTLLTPAQLIEFNKQQGSGMFGGQSPKQTPVSNPFAEIQNSINETSNSISDFFGGLFK